MPAEPTISVLGILFPTKEVITMKHCCTPSASGGRGEHAERLIGELAHPMNTRGMVSIPGGRYLVGGEDHDTFPADGEGPIREVTISGFLLDAHTVTNRQYATFIKETGYQTDAERLGWSFVFRGADRRLRQIAHPARYR